MKHKLSRFFLFFMLALLSAFTLVPPVHQVPEGHRFVPEVVYQKPPVDTITLSAASARSAPAAEVCIPITARNFDRILSMQFSINWDVNVLKLKDIRNFELEGLSQRNFGFHLLDEGLLTFSWYDPDLTGITRSDGFRLYELCFESTDAPGSETNIEFTSTPTIIEITNASSDFLNFRSEAGKVLIEN